jgi:tetratricopeptide (TPR) repeat protein
LVDLGFSHLMESCPVCRENWEEYRRMPARRRVQQRPLPEMIVASAYGAPARQLEARRDQVREIRRNARRDLRVLLALPPDERAQRVGNARTRFRSRALAELLLEESRRRVRSDPQESRALAELTGTVLMWTPMALASIWGQTLQIRSLAVRGNALRVAGRLDEASRAFAEVRAHLAHGSLNDLELHGDVASLEASLRIDQRRFDEAAALLDRAVLFFGQGRLDQGLARVLVKRAELHRLEGEVGAAAADLRRALEVAEPGQDVNLHLCIVGTLALVLCDLGHHEEARRLLDANERWWEAVDEPWWTQRLRILEGRIAQGTGDLDRAERLFTDVLEETRARNQDYAAAIAALDLALVHLAQGATSAVQRLAREAAPVFRSRSIHREALAALALFHQAALAETVTTELAHRVRRFLDRARERPDLPFAVE